MAGSKSKKDRTIIFLEAARLNDLRHDKKGVRMILVNHGNYLFNYPGVMLMF